MCEGDVRPHEGWTFGTLFAFFDHRINSHEREEKTLLRERNERYMGMFASREEATQLSQSAADTAVAKSEASVERRFIQMNKDLKELHDRQDVFIERHEFEAKYETLDEKVGTMQRTANIISGRSTGNREMVAWVIAGGAVVLDLVSRLHIF